MHPLIYIPLLLIYVCLLVFLYGVSWRLPGYNQKKARAGLSATGQMNRRYRTGSSLMNISMIVAVSILGLFFLISLFWIDNYEYEVPNKVKVLMARDQSIALFLIDGEVRKKSIRGSIDEYFKVVRGLQIVDQTWDQVYPPTCIYIERNINVYGWDMTWLEDQPDLTIDMSPECVQAYAYEHLGGILE